MIAWSKQKQSAAWKSCFKGILGLASYLIKLGPKQISKLASESLKVHDILQKQGCPYRFMHGGSIYPQGPLVKHAREIQYT